MPGSAADSAASWLASVWELPGADAASHPLLDRLVGYAIRYYEDFVRPKKRFRAADERERTAFGALSEALAAAPAGAGGEALQNIVYEVGKAHGFEPLRDWFKALYEVLLGQSQGPRFGSFIELYGVAETRDLIAKGLAGIQTMLAFYIGGMGAEGQNYHTKLAARMGLGDAAMEIQRLFLSGDQAGAIDAVPASFADEIALVGPPERIKERLSVWRDSPVTTLMVHASDSHGLRTAAELVLGG